MKKLRGLNLQLMKLLLAAGVCAFLFFIVVHSYSALLLRKHFPGSVLQIQMIEKRIDGFKGYVADNALSATDTAALLKWCSSQPMVLMEIYRDNILFFNSSYVNADPLSDQNIETPRYDWYSYYDILFADGPAEVLVYSDESYVLNTWITIVTILLSGILFMSAVMIGIRKTIRYIYLLCDEIQVMGSGDLDHPITVKGNDELGLLAEELNQMRAALSDHRQKEQEMVRQNNDICYMLSALGQIINRNPLIVV